jgi:hypothetical protein
MHYEAIITCPACGAQAAETTPENACQRRYLDGRRYCSVR